MRLLIVTSINVFFLNKTATEWDDALMQVKEKTGCIPKDERKHVLQDYEDGIIWLKLNKEVTNFVKVCAQCAKAKGITSRHNQIE